MNFLTNIKFS